MAWSTWFWPATSSAIGSTESFIQETKRKLKLLSPCTGHIAAGLGLQGKFGAGDEEDDSLEAFDDGVRKAAAAEVAAGGAADDNGHGKAEGDRGQTARAGEVVKQLGR